MQIEAGCPERSAYRRETWQNSIFISFGENLGENGVILDDGSNDSISAVSNCTVERLPTLVVLPVDHCLRLRPGKEFGHFCKREKCHNDLGLISIRRETRRGASSLELEAAQ